jgi:hypothetical protein
MARKYAYIIAANGTFHLFNNDKHASYCGRVKPGQEDVRLTNALPKGKAAEGLKTCARDTQLSGGVLYGVSVTNTVKDVPGVGKVAVVVTTPAALQKHIDKAAGTPSKAPEATTPAPAKRAGRKAAVVASDGADDANTITVKVQPEDASPYDRIAELLNFNKIGTRVNVGPDGDRLMFDAAGFAYDVWAPEWNASGPAEGWVVTYNDDPASNDPGYAEPMLATDDDVMAWLIEDLSLAKPKRTQKARKVAVNAVETATDAKAQGQDTAKRLVSSHLVTIMSNATAAIEYAEQYGGIDADVIKALRDMATAADLMRKDI